VQDESTTVTMDPGVLFFKHKLQLIVWRLTHETRKSGSRSPTELLREVSYLLELAPPEPTFIVLRPPGPLGGPPRAVQVLLHGSGVLDLETVGVASPTTAGQLDLFRYAACEQMLRLGWKPPEPEKPVWSRRLSMPDDRRHLLGAELLVRVLVDVFQWDGPESVDITVGDARKVSDRWGRPVCSIPGCCPRYGAPPGS
jgi:hypothetical protein